MSDPGESPGFRHEGVVNYGVSITPEVVGVPPVRQFTRQNPCSKLDIWNCFCRGGEEPQYAVEIGVAHSIIGIYTPREMRRAGRLLKINGAQVDTYVLTEKGMEWLSTWRKKYLAGMEINIDNTTE